MDCGVGLHARQTQKRLVFFKILRFNFRAVLNGSFAGYQTKNLLSPRLIHFIYPPPSVLNEISRIEIFLSSLDLCISLSKYLSMLNFPKNSYIMVDLKSLNLDS